MRLFSPFLDQDLYGRRWRNLVTGECRSSPPPLGELDWIEITRDAFCASEP